MHTVHKSLSSSDVPRATRRRRRRRRPAADLINRHLARHPRARAKSCASSSRTARKTRLSLPGPAAERIRSTWHGYDIMRNARVLFRVHAYVSSITARRGRARSEKHRLSVARYCTVRRNRYVNENSNTGARAQCVVVT